MIFITTGHQTPFDRLIRLVDEWANQQGGVDCMAQIGDGGYKPMHMRYCRWLEPEEHLRFMSNAELIIAHAGTGTILQAQQLGKPILTLARVGALGETRNDHQIATVRELAERPGVYGAVDEANFLHLLENRAELATAGPLGQFAEPALLATVRSFITGGIC